MEKHSSKLIMMGCVKRYFWAWCVVFTKRRFFGSLALVFLCLCLGLGGFAIYLKLSYSDSGAEFDPSPRDDASLAVRSLVA